jgi:hypothetical protein
MNIIITIIILVFLIRILIKDLLKNSFIRYSRCLRIIFLCRKNYSFINKILVFSIRTFLILKIMRIVFISRGHNSINFYFWIIKIISSRRSIIKIRFKIRLFYFIFKLKYFFLLILSLIMLVLTLDLFRQITIFCFKRNHRSKRKVCWPSQLFLEDFFNKYLPIL